MSTKFVLKNMLTVSLLLLFASQLYAACEWRKVYCIDGPDYCDDCAAHVPPFSGCTKSTYSSQKRYYVFCQVCDVTCSVDPFGTDFLEGENSKAPECKTKEVPLTNVSKEGELYFEIDFSKYYSELEMLGQTHPEHAFKLMMFEHSEEKEVYINKDLRYSKYTSSVLPSTQFFQWTINGEIDSIVEKGGIEALEKSSTLLENKTTLIVESWSSKLPDGNIEIRTRSVISEIEFPEIEFIPIEILADSIAILEPIKDGPNMYRLVSVKW